MYFLLIAEFNVKIILIKKINNNAKIANSLADVPSPTIKITEASLELVNSPLHTLSQHHHHNYQLTSSGNSNSSRVTSTRKNSEVNNKLHSSIEEKRRLSACSSGSGFNSQHKSSSSTSSMSFRTHSQPSTPTTPPLTSNKEHVTFNDSRTSGDSDLSKRVDDSVESDV